MPSRMGISNWYLVYFSRTVAGVDGLVSWGKRATAQARKAKNGRIFYLR